MNTKITIADKYLEKINKVVPQIEGEGFWVDKIDYTMGYVYGRTECSNRFKAFDFVQEVEDLKVAKNG